MTYFAFIEARSPHPWTATEPTQTQVQAR